MANDLTNIMAKILARGLMVLREQATMPRIVNGDYSDEASKKGATIDVPISSGKTASDVVPSVTKPVSTDSAPGLVQIALDNWKQVDFSMSDKDMVEVDKNEHFMPLEMGEAIRALSNVVNVDILNEYQGVYGYVGTAGTTPFASTVTDATNARKVLMQQLAPKSERRGVLDFESEANALSLAPFSDADKIGTNQIRIEGEIGRKYGIDWYADDAILTHTAGTLEGQGGVIGDPASVGASTVTVRSASTIGNINIGDVFTFTGDTQTYVALTTVSAIVSGTAQNVRIDPPLKIALASSEAVTIKPSHVVNMAFHRDAFAFANRPLVQSTTDSALGSKIISMTDPITGISLRL